MVKLRSLSGVIVESMDEAVPRMLDSGFFVLCDGEVLPNLELQQDVEPEPDGDHEEETGAIVLDAFGDEDDGAEDLGTMTKAELTELARELGAKVPHGANKQAIIDAINEAKG